MSTIHYDLGLREREVIDQVKAATQLGTDADFSRAAAYYFAVFVLGHGAVDTETFRLRGAGKPAASLKIRQKVAPPASKVSA